MILNFLFVLNRKTIKKVLKITLWTLTVLILLVAALLFSLRYKPVQTAIAKRAAKYLSKELKTTVSIDGLYVKPFKSVVLEGLYVQDLDKDTLLHTPKLTVDLNYFSLKERIVSVNTIQLDNGKFYLKTYKTGKTNLQFIVNYFNTGTTKPRKKPKKRYDLSFDKVVLNNIDFRYKNFNRVSILKRINFDDLHLRNLSTTVLDINTRTHLFEAEIQHLNFREKSGFHLKNLSTHAAIDSNQMVFKKLLLQTPTSQLEDYLFLKYKNFKDLNQFVSKVYLNTKLKNTRIHTKDLSYFADNLPQNLAVTLKGNVSGYVNDLKARNFMASAGQATYVKGDFDIKGLPSANKMYLNLRFAQMNSNKKDADRLIKLATGKTNQIPAIAAKFGNVSFKGNFTGFLKDFKVTGDIKTALGRVNTNLRMNMNGVARYSGTVKAYDFNLKELLNRNDLGRTTLSANIVGRGFNLKQIQEDIKADITYFDYKGYRYSNVNINGKYNRSFFNGKIDINDRNIKLNFLGGIDFTSKLPAFNFNAKLRHTNFHKLGFSKDTVQIDADFHTAFTGNNLSNIQGTLQLSKIRMTTPQHSIVVDSVYVRAKGIGNSRSLTINSDILDAGINGQYDLKTLPYYFTSVVKQYIPSLKVKTGNKGIQNFDFTLNLKYFEPISVMYIPALKIPEGAEFRGRFISAENVATLTGSSSLIEYKNIKINNFILDESTTSNALNVFLTADRIDLDKNLYIKNVNVANIFRNDSLSFNVKLSDKDAINQLDLNGLVEFNTSDFASLSLLPSDVIINREVWSIVKQVRFNFDKGKVAIKDFALFRDNQYLTLDGIISTDPDDKLNAGFKHFKLGTFNPLTQSKGVTLAGELNGNISLSSITKAPKIESDLVVDSLVMNNIPIGEMTLVANLDDRTKLVDMVLNIQKDGKETMNIAGDYNANADKNTLNLKVDMDGTELIIFQPFMKHLVSNVTGQVSSQLTVTGNVLDPQINGNARLKNAAMVINYLKTPYRINDDVTIKNSVIDLGELEITDIKNNTAIAFGTVNLKNPKIPVVDIRIEAGSPFMALNTTAKDNPLYYGTAYGVGTFEFKGPTNNMRINITAETQEGTVFNIPLNSAAKVANNDFITFVAKDSSLTPKKLPSFNGLAMTLNLKVDQRSQVNIITDLGVLSGRGNSEALTLNITSFGDFQMFGSYLITSGEFQYTAQEYISKIFEIRQGGSIRWTGDPIEAEINLTAVYAQRVSTAPLYVAAGFDNNQAPTVIAEAVMTLSGALTRPDIKLDINFPQDPYIKDLLQSYLSDVNNRTQQAVSFIARRTFASNTGLNLNSVNETMFSAVTELTFNKLNNILAQTLNLRTIDLNVRSLNDASATFRFFKNRLSITGGVTDTRSGLSSFSVIGNGNFVARDVEAQLAIKKDGSLIARASNRLNNRIIFNANNTQDYVSAIGLVYRKDFDTLGEFLRAILGRKKEEERKEDEQPQAPPPPANTTPSIVIAPVSSDPKRSVTN